MEELTYVIDEGQINELRNRILFKMYKVMGMVLVPLIILEYFSWKNKGASFWLVTIGMIFYMMIIYYVGANRAAKSYRTLKIVLGKEGVESKADRMPYKMVPWAEMEIQEKSDGIILYDKNVSSFMRKMYNRGRIVIPPEILNKESLLSELYKRCSKW